MRYPRMMAANGHAPEQDIGSPEQDHRTRRLRRTGKALLALAAIVLFLELSGCMDRLFFYPSREAFVTPNGTVDVTFATPDGFTLHGWFTPAPDASAQHPAPAILHVHGNAGNVSYHTQLDFLTSCGVSVFTFDYRGFGRSQPAEVTRDGFLTDTRAAWNYLLSRPDVDKSRCTVIGVSIGCTFAGALAAEKSEVPRLVLISPFSSWRRIAHEHVPLLGPLLVTGGPDPATEVTGLGNRPLLLVHGSRDDIVSIANSQRILVAAQNAGVSATLVSIPGAGHNDVMDHELARESIIEFLSR